MLKKNLSLLFILALTLLSYESVNGQSKLTVFGGLTTVSGFRGANLVLASGFSTKLNYYAVDVEYDKRAIGSFSFVTGVSVFNSGYKITDNSFSSNSEFKATYVAIPILARWNVGNRNIFYFDVGLDPYYLINAHLSESISRFNGTRAVTGDITQYSNRLYYATKFQMIFLINRFTIGMFYLLPAPSQSTLKNLDGNWGLNGQQSTYLLSNGFSDFQMIGFKAGWRIK